jgi:hypothetical protein
MQDYNIQINPKDTLKNHKKTGNAPINVSLRRVLATTVAVEKQ